jgi:hypothetical protein
VMDPQVVVPGALALGWAGWRWYGLWAARPRRARRLGRSYPTSTTTINTLALAGSALLAGWLGPLLTGAVTAALGEAPPAWLVDTGPHVLTLAVLAAAAELGCRDVGLWPKHTCPRLAHGPVAAVLPILLVAAWPIVGRTVDDVRAPDVAVAAEASPAPAAAQLECVSLLDPGAEIGGFRGVQLVHAATIVEVVRERGLSDRAALVSLATAMQEASLLNPANPGVPASMAIPHVGTGTDHDSVGTFQQRPSQGWGKGDVAVLMDVRAATGLFLDALVRVPGWEAMPVTRAAQTVQRSAHPDRYARWESAAAAVVAAADTTCTERT